MTLKAEIVSRWARRPNLIVVAKPWPLKGTWFVIPFRKVQWPE